LTKSLPSIINGKSCKLEIANEFAKSFEKACSCNSKVKNSKLCTEFIKAKNSYRVKYAKSEYDFSVEMVNKMVDQLALGKAAGIDNLTVEHIKNCHPIIIVVLTKLFNLMQRYDYIRTLGGMPLQ